MTLGFNTTTNLKGTTTKNILNNKLEWIQHPVGIESNTRCVLDLSLQAGNVDSVGADLCTGTRSKGSLVVQEHTMCTRKVVVHKVNKGCWQVDGMTDTGVLWQHPVPSWGVPWSMCRG